VDEAAPGASSSSPYRGRGSTDVGGEYSLGVDVSTLPQFLRGDSDGGGERSITDGIAILNHLFVGNQEVPALGCLDAADSNDDGRVNLSDEQYLFSYLFLGGPAPPSPLEACGIDPTDDNLDCMETHGSCE
jgi:hypothetical protein